MKTLKKSLMFLVVSMIFSAIIIHTEAFAASSFSFSDKLNVETNKKWTITFNSEVDSSAIVAAKSIVVLDDAGVEQGITITNKGSKAIVISPVKSYEFGKTYRLIVKDTLRSKAGNAIKNSGQMKFTTKAIDINKITKVCIDPAGAANLGTLTGPTGVKDKDVNLAIALKLGAILQEKGVQVTYTRKTDSVSWNSRQNVAQRNKIANNSGAEAFISVRCNQYNTSTANGAENYYLGGDNNSKILAERVQQSLTHYTNAKNREIKVVGSNHINLLKNFNGTGILVYPGFISNPTEEKLLNSSQYQDKIAKSIADGILGVKPDDTDTPDKTRYKVCVDAGHGGYDSGAVGPTGVQEKDVVLKVAMQLGQILKNNGIDVVYTRTSDKTSWDSSNQRESLRKRCEISNSHDVDYFVSVHANSAGPSAEGTETFYGENRDESIDLAQNIQRQLVVATGARDRGVKTQEYYVTLHTNVPAVLVELEFLSNPEKEKLLTSPDYQYKCAYGIARGIIDTIRNR